MSLDELRATGVISHDDPDDVFELVEIIASGAYGSVYKGVDLKSGRELAVKIIAIEEDAALKDMMAEVAVFRKCSPHANVVEFVGCYEKEDELYIAMEFCAGGSSADVYSALERPFAESHIAFIVREVLLCLKHLHARFIIHRDLKAANVLLTDTGAVKLADFGVSAVRKSLDERRQSVIGTPLWMAPEVIDNTGLPVPYDHRVDIWSLGITCLELAEMHPPLHDVHPMRALFLIPTRPPPTLEHPKKWSSDFADFLSRCLVKDPDGRWPVDKLLAHPFLTAHHDAAIGAQLVELLREKKRADAALDAADAAAKSGAKDAPMGSSRHDDDDDDDDDDTSDDDDDDDESHDEAPAPAVPPRRDSDDVSLDSPRAAPSKATSAAKRTASKQASRTALPKDHMAFDEDESSSSSTSSTASTSSGGGSDSATPKKKAPESTTRASIAAKTTARKAAKAKRRERFNTVKSDVGDGDAPAAATGGDDATSAPSPKSGGSSPHTIDPQRSPSRVALRQQSFANRPDGDAAAATPERRAQLDKAHRQALRQRTLEKRQGLAQTTLNARRNLQPEALIEKNDLRKHMEVVRAKQRATAKERARIEKQNELELAEEQRRADAKLALFAKQAQARDRELSEKTVPKELEKQKRQHQTDIKAIAKQHESEMKQLQKSLREQGKSLIKMATEIKDDEPSSAAATASSSSSSVPSSSSSRSSGGESANKKVLKARRELVAQIDATGLALAKSHELEGENALELCRATRQQLADVGFLRLTLCDKQRQVQLETLAMRAEAQVNVDKARQTREQANLSRLQRFTRDALESNQRFEREELNKRARLQADNRLKLYKKGELRTVLEALQAQQRHSSDYVARKRDYKALRAEREAALIDEYSARQAALAEEHNEQLQAYHAYRHTRLEAMHLREMQKLLEMHQSQRLALELSFIDERQRLLQTWFDRRRVILDEDQSTMRSHIIQDQTADAGLRSRHHAARLEHLQKAQDQLRKMASEQSTDTTTQSWLGERLAVLERRRAELASTYERDRETATAHEREQQQHMQDQHAAALAAHRTLVQTSLDAVATDRKKLEAEYERDHSQLLTLQAEQQTLYHQQQHSDAAADSLLAAAAEPTTNTAATASGGSGSGSVTATNNGGGAASPVAPNSPTGSAGASHASGNGELVATTRALRAVSVGTAAEAAASPDRGVRGASPRVVDIMGGGRYAKRDRRKSHHRDRRGARRERAASHAEDLGAPDLHDSQSNSPIASPHPLGATVSSRTDLVDVNPMLQNELLSAKMEEIVRLQSEVAEQRQLREQQLQLQHIQQQLQQDGAAMTTVPKALSPRHRARQSHSPLQRRSSASDDDDAVARFVGKKSGGGDDDEAAELARLAAGFGGESGGSGGSRVRRRQHRSDRRSRRTKDDAATAAASTGEVVVVAAESELTDSTGAPVAAGATVWPWGKEHLERVRQRKLEMEQQQHNKK